jgi:hypothetical protein
MEITTEIADKAIFANLKKAKGLTGGEVIDTLNCLIYLVNKAKEVEVLKQRVEDLEKQSLDKAAKTSSEKK